MLTGLTEKIGVITGLFSNGYYSYWILLATVTVKTNQHHVIFLGVTISCRCLGNNDCKNFVVLKFRDYRLFWFRREKC